MKRVSAVSREDVERFSEEMMRCHSKYRVMFEIGVKTGLRVSDILRLTVGKVLPGKFTVIEQKTGKSRDIELDASLMKMIRRHVRKYKLKKSEYLVFSTERNKAKHLSRVQAYMTMRRVSEKIGIKNTGSHGMRKTYAREMYLRTKNLDAVRREMNHKDATTTLAYLVDDLTDIIIQKCQK
jgi:integrase